MSLRIFIGWDSRFPEPAKVLEYSLRKHAAHPLDIRFLDYAHLQRCYGFNRQPDPLASTEFTYSRFLVPYLCDYSGIALFLDNDMVCLGDILEVTTKLVQPIPFPWRSSLQLQPPQFYALAVTKHDHQVVDGSVKMYGATQTAYPRKNWSSFMLMDCSQLRCWTKEVVETGSGARLHRFQDIPDDQIGDIPLEWNSLDHYDAKTKLIHFTSGGPWYEQYRDCPHADIWYRYREEMLSQWTPPSG